MAIEPVGSGGPPGGLGSLLPLPARQTPPAAIENASTRNSAAAAQPSALRTDSVGASGAVPSQAVPPLGKADIEDAVSKVQKVVASQANNLLFSIDDDSGRTVVKVVDSATQETIRQIPSEEILSIAKALDKLQGLLLKQTA